MGAAFLAVAFVEAVFFEAVFFEAVFFEAVFFEAAFFEAVFFEAVFFEAAFFGVRFVDSPFFVAVVERAGVAAVVRRGAADVFFAAERAGAVRRAMAVRLSERGRSATAGGRDGYYLWFRREGGSNARPIDRMKSGRSERKGPAT